MAWQNQPGQQFSGQPFPGYPGTAFPQQPQIPAEAIAAAQAAGLGMPTREYRKSSSANANNPLAPLSSVGSSINKSMKVTTIAIGAGTVLLAAIMLFTLPTSTNVLTSGIILASGIFTVFMIKWSSGLINRSMSGFGTSLMGGLTGGGASQTDPLIAWSCPEGLVYKQNGQISAVRWTDIQQVWRKAGMLNGMMTTLAYIVQPGTGPQFAFSQLTGPFADMALSDRASGSLSISYGAGEVSNNAGFLQISGAFALTEYAGLGDLIEEQMLQRILPKVQEIYRAGQAVNFGQFSVQQQGISDGARNLAWADLDRVQISPTAIQITKKPASMVWFNLSAATIPNFALLCGLLNTMQEGKA